MKAREDGAPEWDPTTIQEQFDPKVRRRTHRLVRSRTGRSIPYDLVDTDPESADTYQRLTLVVLKAAKDWRPDRGMALEAWIDFRLARTDADASFFEGPLTVPYGVAMDYLSARNSSHDPDEQRANWADRGRDPIDWDTISASQSYDQPTLPGDWTAFLGEERTEEPAEVVPCTRPGPDHLAEGRLFLLGNLTEVERMVLLLHDRDGYSFEKIGTDLLPDHLFDRSGNVKHKVRRIYLRAKAKADTFRNLDGTAL